MNGVALEKKFGGLSANSIFKKEGWESAPSAPPPSPTNEPTKKFETKTTELIKKWKNNPRKTRPHEDGTNKKNSETEKHPDDQQTTKKPRHNGNTDTV